MLNAADEFTRQVEAARTLFFERGQDPQGVPASVVRSWRRSRESGLLTSDQALFRAVSITERRRVEERNRSLIEHATPEMERLYTALAAVSGNWVICCVDDQGRVVKSIGDERLSSRSIRAAFRVGVTMGEEIAGTTAPGCALTDRAPVVINANEHFLEEAQVFSCMATPLLGPAGEVIGALDASCEYDGTPRGLLESLVIATRAIENRMLFDSPSGLRICMQYRPDLLGTPFEAIVVFSEDGRIEGTNPAARQMLGIPPAGIGRLRCEDVLDVRFGQLLDRLGQRDAVALEVRGRGGLRLYARLERPRSLQLAGVPLIREPAPLQRDARVASAMAQARRAYARDIPVLVNGETGTGKEVLARHLHETGARGNGPFVAINCSAIPAGLIESELFGYEDGAFTNARKGGASGKFEQAQGGTLFLDEIGDMPLELQGRLLRVLQERSVSRISGSRTIPIDAAVVCATHQDLAVLVAEGRFREDLFYRINGLRVVLPPLRSRSDLKDLIEAILREESEQLSFSEPAMATLLRYHWPGNLRQLRNVVRIAALMAEGLLQIGQDCLPEEVLDAVSRNSDTPSLPALARAERETIQAVLKKCSGNVSAAARQLGISRATLYRKLKQIGLTH